MDTFRIPIMRGRARRASIACAVMAALAIVLPSAGAAGSTVTWAAAVGASGANGKATITAPSASGTAGSLKLALKGLSASAAYPVKVVKGTCASPGAVLYAGPTQRSTPAGKIAKTLAIPATRMTAIRAATTVALRVGTGAKLRCGPFTGGAPAAGPTPSPEPSLAATLGADQVVGVSIVSIASDATSVWAVDGLMTLAYRLDPATGRPDAHVDFGSTIGTYTLPVTRQSALAGGVLWVPAMDQSVPSKPAGVLLRIDAAAATVLGKVALGGQGWAAAMGAGSVWVARRQPDALLRIDPAAAAITQTIPLPSTPGALSVGSDAAWVASGESVQRVDLATSGVKAIDLGGRVTGVAANGDAVWVAVDAADASPARLVRLVPASSAIVATITLSGSPGEVAAGPGYAWVSIEGDTPSAVGVSTSSNTVVATVVLPETLPRVTVRGRSAWFAGGFGDGRVVRIDY